MSIIEEVLRDWAREEGNDVKRLERNTKYNFIKENEKILMLNLF
jgi:hypothetical protein